MANYETVVGYFPSRSAAEQAVSALKEAGFRQNQIGVAGRSSSSNATTAGAATSTTGSSGSGTAHAAGQQAAGVWQKVKDFFEGDAAESSSTQPGGRAVDDSERGINEPEVTSGSYGTDDLHSSLNGLSVSESRAKYFRGRFAGGSEGAIVTVNAAEREDEAIAILEANGGDIGNATAEPEAEVEREVSTSGQQNIELYGEVLRVHKERISAGEVRIRKEVHTTTQTVEVPVSHEELVIERVAVAGERTGTGTAFDEKEIRIPLSQEVASVDKEAVLREQVRVGKKEVGGVESFDEQVRSEDLVVDDQAITRKTA